MTRELVNYARTVRARPTRWHAPQTEAEVVAIVRAARRVRVVGAAHSFSAIAAPAARGELMSLDRLPGYELAADRRTVSVSGGMRLRAVLAALAADGLTLPIVGSIAEQAVAGAIATGTHGSSLVHGNLASLATALRIVDGEGRTHELAGGDLDAARVHLGALGVVTRVSLRVEPAFQLADSIARVPVGEVASQLEAIARSAEYVKVWWMPHTPDAVVYRYTRTDAPPRRLARIQRWLDQHVVHRAAFPALAAWQRRWPGSIARLNTLAATTARPLGVAPAALALATPMPLHHRETEAALPLARAGEAFAATTELIARGHHRVNFLVEVRFVRGDAGWLSPASGGDVCQLGAYMAQLPGIDAYFADFWRAMRPLGARPHWGKELDHAAPELRALYPRHADFVALRDRMDPRRVLTNAFLERTLGA